MTGQMVMQLRMCRPASGVDQLHMDGVLSVQQRYCRMLASMGQRLTAGRA